MKRNQFSNRIRKAQSRGFTLLELMIVVAIIAILVAIAIPIYQDQVASARRADAEGALSSFANAMERYYTENSTYIGADGGTAKVTNTLVAPSSAVFPSQAPIDSSTKYYNLRIYNLDANSYELRAVPIGIQSGDGFLQLLSNGQRGWDKNDNGSITSAEQSWSQ